MTTQIFRGRTIEDARKAAAEALGKDAVVLTTRHVRRPGLIGLFGAMDCEIAAAKMSSQMPPSNAKNGPFAQSAYRESESERPSRDPLAALRAELRAEIRAVKIGQGRPSPGVPNDLAQEMAAVRDAIEQLAPAGRKGDKTTALLRAMGIEGAVATALGRALRMQKDEALTLAERFRNALSDLVRVSAWPLANEGRAVIAVVGPTGVGKTTTLAKLAARAKLDGKTATLVTCDTFRVGGVEHIARYADLLGMANAVARDASELATVLARTRTDLVFVDTSGREPVVDAAERLLAAASFATAAECRGLSRHVLLCMPANIRASDATRVVKAFSATNPTALAVTKLDETDSPSGLAHGAFMSKLAISVLCAGQRVPEDIAPATMGAVLDAVIRPVGRKAGP